MAAFEAIKLIGLPAQEVVGKLMTETTGEGFKLKFCDTVTAHPVNELVPVTT